MLKQRNGAQAQAGGERRAAGRNGNWAGRQWRRRGRTRSARPTRGNEEGQASCWAEQEDEAGLQAEKGRERERNENTFPNFFSIFPFSFSNQFQLEF